LPDLTLGAASSRRGSSRPLSPLSPDSDPTAPRGSSSFTVATSAVAAATTSAVATTATTTTSAVATTTTFAVATTTTTTTSAVATTARPPSSAAPPQVPSDGPWNDEDDRAWALAVLALLAAEPKFEPPPTLLPALLALVHAASPTALSASSSPGLGQDPLGTGPRDTHVARVASRDATRCGHLAAVALLGLAHHRPTLLGDMRATGGGLEVPLFALARAGDDLSGGGRARSARDACRASGDDGGGGGGGAIVQPSLGGLRGRRIAAHLLFLLCGPEPSRAPGEPRATSLSTPTGPCDVAFAAAAGASSAAQQPTPQQSLDSRFGAHALERLFAHLLGLRLPGPGSKSTDAADLDELRQLVSDSMTPLANASFSPIPDPNHYHRSLPW
jgi:hypothetical protein